MVVQKNRFVHVKRENLRFFEKIIEDIIKLKEPGGSSFSAIKKYIVGSSNGEDLGPDFEQKCFRSALQFGICSGHLVKVNASYKLIFDGKSAGNKLPLSCDRVMCDSAGADAAAAGGHLETLKWLHQQDIRCSTFSISLAVGSG